MDVAITALRAELSTWLQRVRDGEELVVTDRGIPVARLTQIGSAGVIDDLLRRGVVSSPASPGPRPSARGMVRASAAAPVSELVGELRR